MINPTRLRFIFKCNTPSPELRRNVKRARKYNRVKFVNKEELLKYPPCAVVGGGPGLVDTLDELRTYESQGRDIFAVNDTAGFLSDQGIPCFMFAIDATRNLYRTGKLVKGAIFATRIHRRQFNMIGMDKVLTFDMAEDGHGGVTGGPTAVCRAPMLFLRMGYQGIWFYGVDACFYDVTHISGQQSVAHDNMMIVRAGNVDYITNASLFIQTEYLIDVIKKHPKFLVNRSGGLIKAMVEYEDWTVRAIGEDLKKQYDELGIPIWNKEVKESALWQPQQI